MSPALSRVLAPSLLLGIAAAATLLVPWAGAASADEPKILRYAIEAAETGFDPVQLSDLYSRNLTTQVFEAPLHFAFLAPAGTLEPLTTTALPEVSPDFRTWTFHVRPGIYFADDPAFGGKRRELVAQDYVYSIERHFDPRWKSGTVSSLVSAGIEGLNAMRDAALKGAAFDYDRVVPGLRALDRYTFQVRLARPAPRFANLLADSSVMGAVAREVVETYGDRIMEHPVGTGPYRLAEWRRSSFIAFERNPGYREERYDLHPDPADPAAVAIAAKLAGRRLPMIDRVEISVIEESQPRWLSFLNAEHDLLERLPEDLAPVAIPNNEPSATLVRKRIDVRRQPNVDFAYVVYNMDHPVIGGYGPEKVALRRAINLAFDVDELIRSRYKYQALPAQSMVMPSTFGYDAALRTEMGETDVARANALLDAFGWLDRDGDGWREMPDGSPLELELSTQPDQRSRIVDEIWKKSMNAIHVRLRYRTAQWPEQLRMTRNGQYMMWTLGNTASGPDTADALRAWYGPAVGAENLSRFHEARYDRLFDAQNALIDGPERLETIREMQRLFVAYAPSNITTHRFIIDMAYPWVVGYRRWPFARDWWKYVDVDSAARRRETGR